MIKGLNGQKNITSANIININIHTHTHTAKTDRTIKRN